MPVTLTDEEYDELVADRERLEWFVDSNECLRWSERTSGYYVTGFGCDHKDNWREAIDAARVE